MADDKKISIDTLLADAREIYRAAHHANQSSMTHHEVRAAMLDFSVCLAVTWFECISWLLFIIIHVVDLALALDLHVLDLHVLDLLFHTSMTMAL